MNLYNKDHISLFLAFAALFTGYSFSIAAEDNRGPLMGWHPVVVAPIARISVDGRDHDDSDARELVERFLRVLEDEGVRSRKATPYDERFLVLSMGVMTGPDSPFTLRIQHQESVRYLRDGNEVSGTASTWESETLSNDDSAFSTPWPAIEKAMNVLASDLDEAIHGRPDKSLSNREKQLKAELVMLLTEQDQALQSEPHLLHSLPEMRAEYDELKRRRESGDSTIEEKTLAEYLKYLESSEKKVEHLQSLRKQIQAISEKAPDLFRRVEQSHRVSRTSRDSADPFR